ncbi:UNVERIFIED_ORG: hypothetical protein EDF86_0446 [Pseudomonas psychrophila]
MRYCRLQSILVSFRKSVTYKSLPKKCCASRVEKKTFDFSWVSIPVVPNHSAFYAASAFEAKINVREVSNKLISFLRCIEITHL